MLLLLQQIQQYNKLPAVFIEASKVKQLDQKKEEKSSQELESVAKGISFRKLLKYLYSFSAGYHRYHPLPVVHIFLIALFVVAQQSICFMQLCVFLPVYLCFALLHQQLRRYQSCKTAIMILILLMLQITNIMFLNIQFNHLSIQQCKPTHTFSNAFKSTSQTKKKKKIPDD